MAPSNIYLVPCKSRCHCAIRPPGLIFPGIMKVELWHKGSASAGTRHCFSVPRYNSVNNMNNCRKTPAWPPCSCVPLEFEPVQQARSIHNKTCLINTTSCFSSFLIALMLGFPGKLWIVMVVFWAFESNVSHFANVSCLCDRCANSNTTGRR